MRRGRFGLGAAAVALAAGVLLTSGRASAGPIAGFSLLGRGSDGGTLWQGTIPNTSVARVRTGASVVYLPPGFTTAGRYPVVYILHGLPGSPYSVANGMKFARIADPLVASGTLRPFVAVVPAGPPPKYDGEWAGPWERYLIHDVLLWTANNVPVEEVASARTLAGYSAGGFGAIDIGLRHRSLFATLECWSGYFDAPLDGPFRRASVASLFANDPSLLVRRDGAALRGHLQVFLSVGSTHDRWTEARTLAFAAELRTLGVPFRLWLAPGGHDGKFWRRQLPAALEYAVPGTALRSTG